MRKTIAITTAAAALALTAGAVQAQPYGGPSYGAPAYGGPAYWQPIDQRQANLDHRIDVGVRNGQLTRAEALRLRSEFRAIAQLEARYRVGGLSAWERADLDRRFDALSARIRFERTDRQDRDPWAHNGPGWNNGPGRWMNINQRQANLDARIDAGVRSGQITRAEAFRLRAEFQQIARLETRYRAGGLSQWEMADLDRRFDALSARIRYERTDGQQYGWRR